MVLFHKHHYCYSTIMFPPCIRVSQELKQTTLKPQWLNIREFSLNMSVQQEAPYLRASEFSGGFSESSQRLGVKRGIAFKKFLQPSLELGYIIFTRIIQNSVMRHTDLQGILGYIIYLYAQEERRIGFGEHIVFFAIFHKMCSLEIH